MTNSERLIRSLAQESQRVCEELIEQQAPLLAQIADTLGGVLHRGGTIYLCGNGGSAADAQHVAGEFVGRFLRERRPLPAVALTTNTSILTAIGNDYDFSQVFSRQVRAQVGERDALVGISTSGKSANVLQAITAARECGAWTLGFTGLPGEPLASACDLCLRVPSRLTPRIQEAHILAWHIVCDVIERQIDAVAA
jgi:D-sedoheptulose 7-phosphate isomerase